MIRVTLHIILTISMSHAADAGTSNSVPLSLYQYLCRRRINATCLTRCDGDDG